LRSTHPNDQNHIKKINLKNKKNLKTRVGLHFQTSLNPFLHSLYRSFKRPIYLVTGYVPSQIAALIPFILPFFFKVKFAFG
jgi:hypothetical protein